MLNMIALWLILLMFISLSTAVPFEDCGLGGSYKMNSITIDTCIDAPCLLTVGSTIVVNVSFDATYGSNVQQQVYLLLNNVRESVPVVPNICTILTCPVQTARNPQVSSYSVSISNTLPALRGELRWEILDDTGNSILGCLQVSVRLQYSSLITERKNSLKLEAEKIKQITNENKNKTSKILDSLSQQKLTNL